MKGWIKLHRKLIDNGVFYDAELLKVFVWCILKANRIPKEVNGTKLSTGQFITGRLSASEELHMRPTTVYDRLQRLKRMKYISIKSNNKFSIVSVLRYNQYQVGEEEKPKVSIEERQTEFALQVSEYVDTYDHDMLQQFIDYWTEPNKTKGKMRFEMQRTWDIKRRLATWKRNTKTNKEKPNILNTWQEARNIINNGG